MRGPVCFTTSSFARASLVRRPPVLLRMWTYYRHGRTEGAEGRGRPCPRTGGCAASTAIRREQERAEQMPASGGVILRPPRAARLPGVGPQLPEDGPHPSGGNLLGKPLEGLVHQGGSRQVLLCQVDGGPKEAGRAGGVAAREHESHRQENGRVARHTVGRNSWVGRGGLVRATPGEPPSVVHRVEDRQPHGLQSNPSIGGRRSEEGPTAARYSATERSNRKAPAAGRRRGHRSVGPRGGRYATPSAAARFSVSTWVSSSQGNAGRPK